MHRAVVLSRMDGKLFIPFFSLPLSRLLTYFRVFAFPVVTILIMAEDQECENYPNALIQMIP